MDSYPNGSVSSICLPIWVSKLPQSTRATYSVPWGLTVRPVEKKVSLFTSMRVVMAMVCPKYAMDSYSNASVSSKCIPIWFRDTSSTY